MAVSIEITSSAQMEQIAQNLEGLIAQYKQEIEKMYTTVGELQPMWTGEAATLFNNQLTTDKEGFDAYAKVIEQYIEALRNNKNTYITGEQEAVEILKNKKYRR